MTYQENEPLWPFGFWQTLLILSVCVVLIWFADYGVWRFAEVSGNWLLRHFQ